MSKTNFGAIILAAGKGTRMKSRLPKVLHEIAGRPMLGHAIAAAQEAGAGEILLVTSPDQDDVRAYADGLEVTLTHCIQHQQNGTGDAVAAALPEAKKHERLVVMFGDTPLMRAELLHQLANDPCDVVAMGFEPDDLAAYGRIVMRDGAPVKIVEFPDLDDDTRDIRLCNGGAMGITRAVLAETLPLLSNDNAKGEYYLPHLLQIATDKGASSALVMAQPEDTMGVDSRVGQARAEAINAAALAG